MRPHILRASSQRPYEALVRKTSRRERDAPVIVKGRGVRSPKLLGQFGIRLLACPISINSRKVARPAVARLGPSKEATFPEVNMVLMWRM